MTPSTPDTFGVSNLKLAIELIQEGHQPVRLEVIDNGRILLFHFPKPSSEGR